MRNHHQEVFALADKFEAFTAGFPWGRPLRHAADPVENLWRYYNIVFAVASHRLLRASIALMDSGLMVETFLPLRTHLELLGLQRYIEEDKNRVVTFATQGAKRQQQLVERARRLGHGADDDWSALAKRASADLNKLRPHDAGVTFAGRPEEILRETGFVDDVEGVLRVADNWVHMNAAALDFYAEATEDGRIALTLGPDAEGGNLLQNALRYHYAIMDVVNEVLDLGQATALDSLWTEFQQL